MVKVFFGYDIFFIIYDRLSFEGEKNYLILKVLLEKRYYIYFDLLKKILNNNYY